ncbi:helix-turn-helix transcriptional regulator [Acutalibacter caecimuris]|uniref:helix-turn-helix transcriptional regulator n=1 Tax=Acutalibacter caecimuris TaxID=3093657 RepID=UPI002AC9603C|nr:helix-turn-helix transcriptional regulator [Acutalibacter sp. M00118]
MKELRIGQVLMEQRRQRGITQDQLAEYIGVSKAAVSKWETSTTYPDITLLPLLATFFNISIDELIGYEPQMTPSDIRHLCRELAADFSHKPFEEVMDRCREIAKKFFSCPTLLFQLGCLYVNHCQMAGQPQLVFAVLEEAIALFARVREQSDNTSLQEQALNMEALCLLELGRAQEAIELLAPPAPLRMAPDPLLAMAYQQTGHPVDATRVLQAGIYQVQVELLDMLIHYLCLCDSAQSFHETVRRILTLADCFHLESLHPGMLLTAYVHIAQAYLQWDEPENALSTLENYARLAQSDIYPLQLHGDSYFTLLDDWLEENLPLGNSPPRDVSLIQKSIVDALELPVFQVLQGNPRYQSILHTLKKEKRSSI